MSVNNQNYEVKMRILTEPGYENQTWLSFEKYTNKRSLNSIIEGMYNRFKNNKLASVTRVLMFYDKDGNFLERKDF
jgi:hypothetical protein